MPTFVKKDRGSVVETKPFNKPTLRTAEIPTRELKTVGLSQEAYDALRVKDANTLYVIED